MENKKINIIFTVGLNLLLSIALTAAPNYIQTGSCHVSMTFIITTIWTFMGVNVVTWFLRVKFVNFSNHTCTSRSNKYLEPILNSKYNVLFIALIIIFCWLPFVIALYPGTLINDTWGQLQEFLTFTSGGVLHRGALSDHHPFFDTLVMGAIITPFGEIFHNWQLGIFVYTMIQVIFSSVSFSLTVVFAYKKLKLRESFIVFMIIFYSICPIFPASVQTVSKDALFSWIYVIFLLCFLEAIITKNKSFDSFKYNIYLLIFASLSVLTKKVGLYVVVLSLLALILFIPKNRLKSLSVLISVLLISVGLAGVVKNVLGVVPGGKQEMFSLPFQQTARFYKYHKNEVNKKEYTTINKVLTMKNIEKRYNPTLADPVKGYNDRGTTKEYINYLKVWFYQGLQQPKVYFNAAAAMLSGWFSFAEYDPLMNMSWHSQLNPNMIPVNVANRSGYFKYSSKTIQQIFDDLYNNPIFKIFLSYAFYAAILPVVIVPILFRKKNKYYWIAAIPMIVSIFLGCWLAPVSILFEGRRYLYPIIYTSPIMLAFCVSSYKITDDNKKSSD